METITKPMPAFCSFPFHQINVVHDGNVSLCCMDLLVQEVMGNVKDEGVLGVWFGEKFAEVRRKLLNYDRTCTDICKVCDWRGFKGLTGALEPLNRAMTHVA